MVSAAGHAEGGVRRLLRPWYAKAGLVVLGLVVVMFVLMAIPDVRDPTEGVFPVTVVNSIGRTVDVGMCADAHCHSTVDRHTLKPGASFWQNLGPDASVPFRVTATDGSPLGCWLLPARTHDGHYTVGIASTVPCSSMP